MNLSFLIARRKNIQRLKGGEFFASLERVAGIRSEVIALLAPQEAVKLELALEEFMQTAAKKGQIKRITGVTLDMLESKWRHACQRYIDEREIVVMLSCFPDFSFRTTPDVLESRCAALLELDGETVYVTTPDLRSGFAADRYSDEHGIWEYEFDCWVSV